MGYVLIDLVEFGWFFVVKFMKFVVKLLLFLIEMLFDFVCLLFLVVVVDKLKWLFGVEFFFLWLILFVVDFVVVGGVRKDVDEMFVI